MRLGLRFGPISEWPEEHIGAVVQMPKFSIEESRAIDAKLLAALTGEWQRARDVGKRAGCCSVASARDRLTRLAEAGMCQCTDIRFRNRANATHVYRANLT
jgi:hypothetical protein